MPSAKLDAKTIRQRRRRAARLFGQGHSQAEVARRCGVGSTTAMRWYHAWLESGKKSLEPQRRGRPPQLSEAQRKQIEQALLRGPQAHGWSTDLWTLERVARVIHELAGVRYHPGHVWRVLRGMGWSLQRPTTRARERDEEAILHWKKRTWPRLKKSPAGAGRSSS